MASPPMAIRARDSARAVRQQERRGLADLLRLDLRRVLSHCRFVLPFIRFTPDVLRGSVPLFLKRQCDRTLASASSQ